jgi:hypothetical protein
MADQLKFEIMEFMEQKMDILVDKKSSFLNFLYPLSFNPDTFLDRLKVFDNEEWNGRGGAFKIWVKQNFPEDDLLPHVSKFLNPPNTITPTARIWKLSNEALTSAAGGLGGGEEEGKTFWFLSTRYKEISFKLLSINMVLFNTGIGFVTICAEPKTNEMLDWLDFLHFFRFTNSQREVAIRICRKTGFNNATKEGEFCPFFPVPAGGLTNHPEGKGTIDDIIKCLLTPACIQNETTDWWSEIYTPGKLLPFTSIFMDDVPASTIPILIYQIRNFFHSKENINPSEKDISCENDSLLPYGKDQWFFFSLDGGGFVAFNSQKNNFTRAVLPDHLSKHYFLLYILTIHQRFALIKLLDDIASHWYDNNTITENEQNNEKRTSFERIRNNLLSFTARGYYAQAMQSEHHHRCYKKWQTTFQVERLYKEVKDEVWSMNESISMQHERKIQEYEEAKRLRGERLEKQLSFLAWLIGIPALSLTYYEASVAGDWLTALGYLFGGLIIGTGLYYLVRRITQPKKSKIP